MSPNGFWDFLDVAGSVRKKYAAFVRTAFDATGKTFGKKNKSLDAVQWDFFLFDLLLRRFVRARSTLLNVSGVSIGGSSEASSRR